MPFSEYLPLERTFPFLRRLLPDARSVQAGKYPEPLNTPGGAIAPLICYEVLFSGYVRRLVRQGSLYIVNLTNDRWYGARQQPIQHLGMTVPRAIENRRSIARCTNSGISAFIDARGVVDDKNRTMVMERTILRSSLALRGGTTIYCRHGDILHRWILTPLYIFLFLYGFVRRRNEVRVGVDSPGRSRKQRHRLSSV